MLVSSASIASPSLLLSEAEEAYLASIQKIRLCTDPDWLPYEGIDENGKFVGIMSDFHQLWSSKIGKQVELVVTDSWQQSLDFVKEGRCDILSSAQKTINRKDYLNFTQPFINYPLTVATQPQQTFVLNLGQVLDKTFVMVKGYAGVDLVKQHYPSLKIRLVDDAKTGLELVEQGQAFAYIDTVPSISYQMLKHGISYIQISGVLEQHYSMSVAVRKELTSLLSIFNKVIANTTEVERQNILNDWLAVKVQYTTDYTSLKEVLAVVAALFALIAYHSFMVRKHNQELVKINRQLEHISNHDQLTGIPNRYSLHQAFSNESKRLRRYKHAYSMIILDIDLFKRINDSLGHTAGDSVIKTVASLLIHNIRESDFVGRWGGEEFLILCPETDISGAAALAEGLRKRIELNEFGIDRAVTASFGVAEFRDNEPMEECIKRADRALYQAKQSGRNRVVTASSTA